MEGGVVHSESEQLYLVDPDSPLSQNFLEMAMPGRKTLSNASLLEDRLVYDSAPGAFEPQLCVSFALSFSETLPFVFTCPVC